MPSKTIAVPRWKLLCTVSLLVAGAALLPRAQAQVQERAPESQEYQGNSIPSATAPAYGGAATEGGPGSINPATGERIPPPPPPLGSSGASATPQQAVANADRNLMRMLAEIHMAEVDMGKMAQTRSPDIQVRSFAQRMIDDHGAALEQLQQLADAKGVLLPGGPGKRQAAVKEKLTALTGDEFSRLYLQYAGDTAHREAHQLLQQALQNAQDPQLRAQAGTSLALVEQHFQMGNHVMATYRQGQETQTSGETESIQDEAPPLSPRPQQRGVQIAPGSPPR
jgi:putative membrane protein